MSGEELYGLLRAVWQRPENSEWGVLVDPWEDLGMRRRTLWERCAASIQAELRTVVPSPVPTGKLVGTLEQITAQVIADRMKQLDGHYPTVAKSLRISVRCLYSKCPVEKELP